ncbi:MAG: hypothetical protein ACKO5P_01570 [Nodosilinea sp.]
MPGGLPRQQKFRSQASGLYPNHSPTGSFFTQPTRAWQGKARSVAFLPAEIV